MKRVMTSSIDSQNAFVFFFVVCFLFFGDFFFFLIALDPELAMGLTQC